MNRVIGGRVSDFPRSSHRYPRPTARSSNRVGERVAVEALFDAVDHDGVGVVDRFVGESAVGPESDDECGVSDESVGYDRPFRVRDGDTASAPSTTSDVSPTTISASIRSVNCSRRSAAAPAFIS